MPATPAMAGHLLLAVLVLPAPQEGRPIPVAEERGVAAPLLDMAIVNAMAPEAFVRTFGGVFENSPWVAERAASARPFASAAALHAAMMEVVRQASPAEIRRFLNAHPELAGPEARARSMTAHSAAEQGSAGLDRMTEADVERFARLNAAYRDKFGFPFIIAVRGRTKDAIVAAFEQRLANPEAKEWEAALAEVAAITRMRLERILGPFG